MRRLSIVTSVVAMVMTAGAMFAPAAIAAVPNDPPNPGNESSNSVPQKAGHKLSKPGKPVGNSDDGSEAPTPSVPGEESADGQPAAPHAGRVSHPAKQGDQYDDNAGDVKPGKPAAGSDDSVGNAQVNKPAKPVHHKPAGEKWYPESDTRAPKGDTSGGAQDTEKGVSQDAGKTGAADTGKGTPADAGKSAPAEAGKGAPADAGKGVAGPSRTNPVDSGKASSATPAITDENPDSTGPVKAGHPVKSTSQSNGSVGEQQNVPGQATEQPVAHPRPFAHHGYRPLHHTHRPMAPGYRPLTHRFGPVEHSAPAGAPAGAPGATPSDHVSGPATEPMTEPATGEAVSPTTQHPVRPLHHSAKTWRHHRLHHVHKPMSESDQNLPMNEPKGFTEPKGMPEPKGFAEPKAPSEPKGFTEPKGMDEPKGMNRPHGMDDSATGGTGGEMPHMH